MSFSPQYLTNMDVNQPSLFLPDKLGNIKGLQLVHCSYTYIYIYIGNIFLPWQFVELRENIQGQTNLWHGSSCMHTCTVYRSYMANDNMVAIIHCLSRTQHHLGSSIFYLYRTWNNGLFMHSSLGLFFILLMGSQMSTCGPGKHVLAVYKRNISHTIVAAVNNLKSLWCVHECCSNSH